MREMNLETMQRRLVSVLLNPQDAPDTDFLIAGGTLTTTGSVEVYQRGYASRLTEALGETFKSVWWVLGDELFFSTCRDYIQKHPSGFYNLSDYGGDFAEYLGTDLALSGDYPFIVDQARLEWLYKDVFHRPQHISVTEQVVAAHFSGEKDCTIKFGSAVAFFESSHPVCDVWRCCKTQTGQDTASINWGRGQCLVIYKQNEATHIKELKPSVWHILKELGEGSSFFAAIETCRDKKIINDEQPITEAFQFAVQTGIIEGIG